MLSVREATSSSGRSPLRLWHVVVVVGLLYATLVFTFVYNAIGQDVQMKAMSEVSQHMKQTNDALKVAYAQLFNRVERLETTSHTLSPLNLNNTTSPSTPVSTSQVPPLATNTSREVTTHSTSTPTTPSTPPATSPATSPAPTPTPSTPTPPAPTPTPSSTNTTIIVTPSPLSPPPSDPHYGHPSLVNYDEDGFPILTEEQIKYYSTQFYPEDPRSKIPPYVGNAGGYWPPNSGCGDKCWLVRHVDDYHEMYRRLNSNPKNHHKIKDIKLLQWPIIRNITTSLYHLLGKPDVQFPIENLLIPNGMGKFGLSPQPGKNSETYMPELHQTRMNWVLKAHNVLVNCRGSLYHEGLDIAINGLGCHWQWSGGKAGMPRETHDKVVILSQYWGYGPYHFLIECLPRLMGLTHLINDKNVKFHVELWGDADQGNYAQHVAPVIKNVFGWLGIDQSRVVFGNIYAKTVYWVPPTPCGMADPVKTPYLAAFLQKLLRDKVGHRLLPLGTSVKDGNGTVLFIQRTNRMRRILQFNQLVDAVMAQFPNKPKAIYSDNPSPSFEETLIMFYNADIVVSPHGAGMSNTLASRHRTRVYELKASDWHTWENRTPGNCFQLLAWHLGHNYNGMAPKVNDRDRFFSLTNEEISKVAKDVKELYEKDNIRDIKWM